MAKPKPGMGRGLSAILSVSTEGGSTPGEELRELPLELIVPNPKQPRRDFDAETLQELAGSLGEQGVLQPVLVRPRAGGTYELVAGERRWRAARIAGLERIPALVREREDAAALEVALIENMAREDLNPIEEARACAALVEELGLTRKEIGRRVGPQPRRGEQPRAPARPARRGDRVDRGGRSQRGPRPRAAARRGPRRAPLAGAPGRRARLVGPAHRRARARGEHGDRRPDAPRASAAAPRPGAGRRRDRAGARRGPRGRGEGARGRDGATPPSCAFRAPRRRSSSREGSGRAPSPERASPDPHRSRAAQAATA